MKRLTLPLLSLCLALSLAGCRPALDDRLSQADIFALVEENQTLLLDAIASQDYTEVEALEGIHSVSPYNGYIDFSCSGAGLGSETFYAGFYYIPADDPAVIFPNGLTAQGDGFLLQDPAQNSDNTGYLEKICDHFYYYDLSF